MEFHIHAQPEEISRYVFCPGHQNRAKRIADHFQDVKLVHDDRGIVVYSGLYNGVFMTSCGTGMGGPAVGIALEELANLGADTFVRVGSCGVFQSGQQPGDVIIATGTFRAGGTSHAYLPLAFPAVPTFEVLRELVRSAEKLELPYTTGVGIAGDAFYGPNKYGSNRDMLVNANIVSAAQVQSIHPMVVPPKLSLNGVWTNITVVREIVLRSPYKVCYRLHKTIASDNRLYAIFLY